MNCFVQTLLIPSPEIPAPIPPALAPQALEYARCERYDVARRVFRKLCMSECPSFVKPWVSWAQVRFSGTWLGVQPPATSDARRVCVWPSLLTWLLPSTRPPCSLPTDGEALHPSRR